jgi:MarR family transcriptional regulator for hemolysin
MSPSKEELSLWWLISLARQAMSRARQKELSDFNITLTKSFMFSVIGILGHEATPKNIAQWRLLEPHSVSEVLTRMEKEGFVKKVKDLKNKSMIRIKLTKKGHEFNNLTKKRYAVHRIMSSLNEKERKQLKSVMEILLKSALEEIGSDGDTLLKITKGIDDL